MSIKLTCFIMNSFNAFENQLSVENQRNALIRIGNNEDNLYGVYERKEVQNGSIALEVVPNILCVNLEDISPIQWLEQFNKITLVSGAELRKTGKLKYLAGEAIPESLKEKDFSRVSVGTVELIPAKNIWWKVNWHVATVHRGRSGYPANWDQRTTTAWWALGSDLHLESLREAVEESSMLGVNANWEYELCLPTMVGVDESQLTHWMDLAINTFLNTNGKYDLMLSREWATLWDPQKVAAWEYARKVFSRNFHGIDKKYRFSVEKFWEILREIRNNGRYSFRKSETLNQEQIDAMWIGVKLQKFQVSEVGLMKEWMFWVDDDKINHMPHAFRILSNIVFPEWFTPIFRFYSESGVHYARNPRIENARGGITTDGLKVGSSVDIKPVPFLAKFAIESTSNRVSQALNNI